MSGPTMALGHRGNPGPPPVRTPSDIGRLAAMPYDQYLRTGWWQWRRKRSLWLAGYRCRRCQRDRCLQVHHVTYARRGDEADDDLEVLCNGCHRDEHFPLPAPPTRTHPGELWVVSGAAEVRLPPNRAFQLAESSREDRLWYVQSDGTATRRRPLTTEVDAQVRALSSQGRT
jgi:hypothetical protein